MNNLKCSVSGCSVISQRDSEYCKHHFIEEKEKEFCDITEGGFFKWVEFFLKEYMPQRSPDIHREIVALFFSLYNPNYINRYNRQLEEIAYRGSGKSTVLNFFIPLYLMTHNGKKIKIFAEVPENGTTVVKKIEVVLKEKFGVIASKTGSLAEEFVVRMRDELVSNRRLKMFYGAKIEDAIDSIDGQWTRKAFKFNGCYILGVGSGQMIRGRVNGAYRPTFIIFDDIYDETNITDTQRKTIRGWFYAGAMNSLDDLMGKALLTGTILHEDTVLVECMNSSMWKSVKFYPMPLQRFKDLLKHFKVNEANRVCHLPFEDESNEIIRTSKQIQYFGDLQTKEDWQLAWAERNSLYYMAIKYKDAVETSSTSLFYQEYFHLTVSEGMKKFRSDYFQKVPGQWRVFTEFGYNWFECKDMYYDKTTGNTIPQIINIEFGCDLSGISSEADNTVIQPVGALPDKRLIVFPTIYGKMNSRDVLHEDSASLFRYEKVVLDRAHVQKLGFLDELFRQYLDYRPSQIKIGIAGEENKTPEDVRLLFQANDIYCQVTPRPQNKSQGNKYERIRYTCLKYYETLSVYHTNGCGLLELELEHLTKYPTDDVADGLECGFVNIQFPAPVSYQQFVSPEVVRGRGFKKKWITGVTEFDYRVN